MYDPTPGSFPRRNNGLLPASQDQLCDWRKAIASARRQRRQQRGRRTSRSYRPGMARIRGESNGDGDGQHGDEERADAQ